MPQITKKTIRGELRRVRSLHAGQRTNVFGFRMYWRKLMKPQGVPGYVWNPQLVIEAFYTMPGRTNGPFDWSGNTDAAVDVLHARLKSWHACPDWDGLFIGPGVPEMEACACSSRE